jgi:uncharacterized protein YbaP (TraB family)
MLQSHLRGDSDSLQLSVEGESAFSSAEHVLVEIEGTASQTIGICDEHVHHTGCDQAHALVQRVQERDVLEGDPACGYTGSDGEAHG